MANNRGETHREMYSGIEIKTGMFYPGNDPENGPATTLSVWRWNGMRYEAETFLEACAVIDTQLDSNPVADALKTIMKPGFGERKPNKQDQSQLAWLSKALTKQFLHLRNMGIENGVLLRSLVCVLVIDCEQDLQNRKLTIGEICDLVIDQFTVRGIEITVDAARKMVHEMFVDVGRKDDLLNE